MISCPWNVHPQHPLRTRCISSKRSICAFPVVGLQLNRTSPFISQAPVLRVAGEHVGRVNGSLTLRAGRPCAVPLRVANFFSNSSPPQLLRSRFLDLSLQLQFPDRSSRPTPSFVAAPFLTSSRQAFCRLPIDHLGCARITWHSMSGGSLRASNQFVQRRSTSGVVKSLCEYFLRRDAKL